jgi:hypothetical protein
MRLDSPFYVEFFCLPKESNKILSSTSLFDLFQNPVEIGQYQEV